MIDLFIIVGIIFLVSVGIVIVGEAIAFIGCLINQGPPELHEPEKTKE